MTQRQQNIERLLAKALAKIEELERQLRIKEATRKLFLRHVSEMMKSSAKERKKLKREIELLRGSP